MPYNSCVGTISGHVYALEEELDYFKRLAKEQQEVIEQLHRGYALPGKPTYIHPADFMEVVENLPSGILYFDFNYDPRVVPDTHVVDGIRYKQSTAMPKITKKFE